MLLVQFCSFFVLFTSIFCVFLHARTHGSLRPVGPVWTRTRIHGNPVPATAGLIPYGDGDGSSKFTPQVPREHHYRYPNL
jgi:hypothetical protein